MLDINYQSSLFWLDDLNEHYIFQVWLYYLKSFLVFWFLSNSLLTLIHCYISDTFVYNGKKSYLHTITTPNRFQNYLLGEQIDEDFLKKIEYLSMSLLCWTNEISILSFNEIGIAYNKCNIIFVKYSLTPFQHINLLYTRLVVCLFILWFLSDLFVFFQTVGCSTPSDWQ